MVVMELRMGTCAVFQGGGLELRYPRTHDFCGLGGTPCVPEVFRGRYVASVLVCVGMCSCNAPVRHEHSEQM